MGFAVDAGERGGAWDEVYYLSGDDVQDGIVRMTETLGLIGLKRTSVVGRRLACLADDCYMYYLRVAKVGARGVSRVLHDRQNGYRSESNYAGDCAVMRAHSDSNALHREIRLGGIPDSWVQNNTLQASMMKSYVWDPAGSSGTFLGRLVANGGIIRYRTSAIGGPQSFNILSASKNGQYGLVTVTTNRNVVYDVNVPVVISVRGQPQFRGQWKVQDSQTAGVLVLSGSERISVPPTVKGYVSLGTYDGVAIARVDAAFVSEHKLGKKKFQRRGRQSTKLLRH